jgi:hypothetical protein
MFCVGPVSNSIRPNNKSMMEFIEAPVDLRGLLIVEEYKYNHENNLGSIISTGLISSVQWATSIGGGEGD